MAHPDPKRGGSEKGQRQHAGQISRYSDLGMKDHSQHGGRGGEATPRDDVGAQASAGQGSRRERASGTQTERSRAAQGERESPTTTVRGRMSKFARRQPR